MITSDDDKYQALCEELVYVDTSRDHVINSMQRKRIALAVRMLGYIASRREKARRAAAFNRLYSNNRIPEQQNVNESIQTTVCDRIYSCMIKRDVGIVDRWSRLRRKVNIAILLVRRISYIPNYNALIVGVYVECVARE